MISFSKTTVLQWTAASDFPSIDRANLEQPRAPSGAGIPPNFWNNRTSGNTCKILARIWNCSVPAPLATASRDGCVVGAARDDFYLLYLY